MYKIPEILAKHATWSCSNREETFILLLLNCIYVVDKKIEINPPSVQRVNVSLRIFPIDQPIPENLVLAVICICEIYSICNQIFAKSQSTQFPKLQHSRPAYNCSLKGHLKTSWQTRYLISDTARWLVKEIYCGTFLNNFRKLPLI